MLNNFLGTIWLRFLNIDAPRFLKGICDVLSPFEVVRRLPPVFEAFKGGRSI